MTLRGNDDLIQTGEIRYLLFKAVQWLRRIKIIAKNFTENQSIAKVP